MSIRTINVDYLARVEGEGSLHLSVKDGELTDVAFKIFEPPRYFEAFLRGRKFSEAPDITARICGICPIAYQMSAVHAMEQAFGVTVGGQLRALRRLIYCGEWIESHGLHVYMLHAPDFMGYQDAIQMAADHPQLVKNGLALKKAGNELMTLIGGREIHPINVKVGDFIVRQLRPNYAPSCPSCMKHAPSPSKPSSLSAPLTSLTLRRIMNLSPCATLTNTPSTKAAWFPIAG